MKHPQANMRAIRQNQSSHFTDIFILREINRNMTATIARNVKTVVMATRTLFPCSIRLGIKSTGDIIEAILKIAFCPSRS